MQLVVHDFYSDSSAVLLDFLKSLREAACLPDRATVRFDDGDMLIELDYRVLGADGLFTTCTAELVSDEADDGKPAWLWLGGAIRDPYCETVQRYPSIAAAMDEIGRALYGSQAADVGKPCEVPRK